jgi:hypothetical protein
MANFFDQFDAPAQTSGNFFDQFDVPVGQSRSPDDPISAKSDAPLQVTVRPGEKPKTSGMEAFGRGVGQGVTFNFYDELAGLMRAGGASESEIDEYKGQAGETHPLMSIVKGAYRKIQGDPEADQGYQSEVARQRARSKELQTEHPGASLGGQVAGAVALPGGAFLNAATVPARMARGAAVGAGYGGIAGFGEGEGLGGSAAQGLTGGLVGGVVGAAAPPLVEGVIRGGRAVSQGVRSGLRGAFNPDAEASRRVATAIGRDIQADPAATTRLTPQEFTASRQNQGPAAVIDLGGETTRALARSAANTSPEGRQALNTVVNDRFEGQGGRVTDWLRYTFNFPNADTQQKAIEQAAKAANAPAYAKAMRDGRGGIWDQELAAISEAPAMQTAVQAAIKQAQNRSAPDVSKASVQQLQARWMAGGKPTLEFWDLVKRQIDQKINVAKRAGESEDVQELTRIKSFLVGKLDAAVPSYSQARAGAAAFFGAENALEAGQNFVTQNFNNRETRAALARMSDLERQLFQDGFVDRLIQTLEKVNDRRSIVGKIYADPANREKITIALGPQRAAELEAGLRVEGIMDFARTAIQGNSTTARQLIERGLAGGGLGIGGVGAYNMDPTQMTVAAVMGAIAGGSRRIDQRVARRVAEMLASDDPASIARGVQIIARSHHFMEALRNADRLLVPAGGQQSAKVPAITSFAGRPEDEQPAVNGPPL